MKLTTFTAAAIFASFLAGAVSATPVTLKYNGYTGGRVSVTTNTVGPYTNRTVGAGALSFTDTTGPLGDFIAWCLDLTTYVGTGTPRPYEITNTPFTNSYGLDSAQKSRVQNMFDANYGAAVKTDREQAAGFQLALWEVLYDDDHSLTTSVTPGSNTFKGHGLNYGPTSGSDITGYANGFLAAANGYSDPVRYKLSFLESKSIPHRQNFVTVAPVPLPAAGLMLLFSLAGLGLGAARRRKTVS